MAVTKVEPTPQPEPPPDPKKASYGGKGQATYTSSDTAADE